MNYFYPGGKISLDRGNLIKAGKYYIYPVYHPAAALRRGTVMEDFKNDFSKIPEMLIKAEELIEKGESEKVPDFDNEDLDGQLFLDL
jgi:hypothetical protein